MARRDTKNDQALLEQLAGDWGFDDPIVMMMESLFDSVSPAICTTPGCGYSTEMEPDQDRGWCEICEQNTVVSAPILAGVM